MNTLLQDSRVPQAVYLVCLVTFANLKWTLISTRKQKHHNTVQFGAVIDWCT